MSLLLAPLEVKREVDARGKFHGIVCRRAHHSFRAPSTLDRPAARRHRHAPHPAAAAHP
jgi:hypothetical protein